MPPPTSSSVRRTSGPPTTSTAVSAEEAHVDRHGSAPASEQLGASVRPPRLRWIVGAVVVAVVALLLQAKLIGTASLPGEDQLPASLGALVTGPGPDPGADLPFVLPPGGLAVEAGSPTDVVATVPTEQRPEPQSALTGWSEQLGPIVGVPAVALAAYGAAQLAVATADPGCHLSWPTLAGIGSVESDHGRFDGAVLRADGRSEPPIIGVALDGAPGVAAITDSDDARLDGDPVHDRAVGPMQFIPTTWAVWAADGDADGVEDPFDIDDAALAAAGYLCAAGGDLATGAGWTRAAYAYNASGDYVISVRAAADAYAQRSRGVTS